MNDYISDSHEVAGNCLNSSQILSEATHFSVQEYYSINNKIHNSLLRRCKLTLHGFQNRRIILLDKRPGAVIARGMLRSPLGLVIKLVEALFEKDPRKGLLRYKDQLDAIKRRAAGLARAELLGKSYSVAKYSVYAFAFQQFFHSSYRARQGIVLEKVVEAVLENTNLFQVVKGAKNKELTIRRLYNINLPKNEKLPDIDVLAIGGRDRIYEIVFMFQTRSTDVTGGTTAKGSLADLLIYILRYGDSERDTYYILVVWEPGLSAQKHSLINKVWDRLSPFIGRRLSREEFTRSIEEGVQIPGTRIVLRLVYGIDKLAKVLTEYTGNREIGEILRDTWDALMNWDDLWLSYAVASLEIENIIIRNVSNTMLLEKYMKKAGILLSTSYLDNYTSSSVMIAQKIIPLWDRDTLPVRAPSDIANYIRDLVLLKMIHYGLQEGLVVI